MAWIKGKLGKYFYHHCSKCGFSPDMSNISQKKLPKICPLCGAINIIERKPKDGKKKKGTG